MESDPKKLVLKWPYLTIGLLPILVFFCTDVFLHVFGEAVDVLPQYFLPFDTHREAAGRLTVMGFFIVFVGVAVGAIAYFGSTVWLLTKWSKIKVLVAFPALFLSGLVLLVVTDTRQMQDYLGPSFVCTALGYTPQLSSQWTRETEKAARPNVKITNLRPDTGCQNRRFSQLRTFLEGHKFATMLCIAAIVLGSICCLAALPGTAATREEKLAHYEEQSARLNLYLYLSALFLVSDLFFVGAYSRWFAYVLPSATAYDAHANAFVGYLGFSYSLLIASFYVPVAAFLARNVKELKPDKNAEGLPDAFTGPLQVLKIGSAIFSTALAGALPAILGLGT